MKIAQISPLMESVPPRLYGGTERVVSYVTEELVRMGHEVTLFASGDSVTSAELVPVVPRALRCDPAVSDCVPYNCLLLDRVFRRAHEFDLLHFHIDFVHYPMARAFGSRIVTTVHGRLDLPDFTTFYRSFPLLPLVSISDSQRAPLMGVNWIATVPHGLPPDLLDFYPKSDDYLVFLGRISPEKRPDRAIAIARASGMPLKIAAKVDRADREYFESVIEPLLGDAAVEFLGEVGGEAKNRLLGGAKALLFPIDWPEPFGLAMIESFACGTPVIAFDCGSVPEVIDDGITGFIVNSIEEAVDAVGRIGFLDRSAVRRRFEERFLAERMASDYVAVYEKLLVSERTRVA
jgi:glycosyltransferase involved in cell wall biosynthesis